MSNVWSEAILGNVLSNEKPSTNLLYFAMFVSISLLYYDLFLFRCNKLTSVLNGAEEMLDPEWIRLADQVGNEWLENMKEMVALIGSSRKEDERSDEELKDNVNLDELCLTAKTWLTNMTNGLESEDGKLMQVVSISKFNHYKNIERVEKTNLGITRITLKSCRNVCVCVYFIVIF